MVGLGLLGRVGYSAPLGNNREASSEHNKINTFFGHKTSNFLLAAKWRQRRIYIANGAIH